MPGNTRITRLIDIFTKFNKYMMIFPMLALLAIMLLDGVNIISIRFFGVRATPVQKELIEELLIVCGYVALAYITLAAGTGHIKTEMIKDKLPPKLRFAADIFVGVVCVAVSAYIVYSSSAGLAFSIKFNSMKEGMILIPMAPFFAVIPISFFLFFVTNVLLLIRNITSYGEAISAAKKAPTVDELTKNAF